MWKKAATPIPNAVKYVQFSDDFLLLLLLFGFKYVVRLKHIICFIGLVFVHFFFAVARQINADRRFACPFISPVTVTLTIAVIRSTIDP